MVGLFGIGVQGSGKQNLFYALKFDVSDKYKTSRMT